ncbi:MAG: hypothetical protein GQ468_05280 [Candidatus Scalindua sp.]|nr:hypothetical protein [Candidatus Scalindua sp.]
MTFHVPDQSRVLTGKMRSERGSGNNGAFRIYASRFKLTFKVIASDGAGWEHVSVSIDGKRKKNNQSPTWEEMCYIKAIFWDDDDTVIEYHPPRTQYVNDHPHCLHLWRKIGFDMPIPDPVLLGTV